MRDNGTNFTPGNEKVDVCNVIESPELKDIISRLRNLEVQMAATSNELKHTGSKEAIESLRADMGAIVESKIRPLAIAAWTTAIASCIAVVAMLFSIITNIPWAKIVWLIIHENAQ